MDQNFQQFPTRDKMTFYWLLIENVFHPCRVESCREAMAHSQGMVLFGSKLKLVPLEVNGKCNILCSISPFGGRKSARGWQLGARVPPQPA